LKLYTDFQEQIALTYTHAMFSNYLANSDEKDKEYGKASKAFQDYLEVGLGIALRFAKE
jgi:hypothetical protein